MTSRSNLNTLRELFIWNSIWYSKNSYKQLVFRDLVIEVYLSGIFYKLRMPSSYFIIKNIYFDFYIIETDLFLLRKEKITYLFLHHSKAVYWAKIIFFTSRKYLKRKYGFVTIKTRERFIYTIKKYQLFLEALFDLLLFTINSQYLFFFNNTNISSADFSTILYLSKKNTNLLSTTFKLLPFKMLEHRTKVENRFSITNHVSVFMLIAFLKETLLKKQTNLVLYSFPVTNQWFRITTIFFGSVPTKYNFSLISRSFLSTLSAEIVSVMVSTSKLYRLWVLYILFFVIRSYEVLVAEQHPWYTRSIFKRFSNIHHYIYNITDLYTVAISMLQSSPRAVINTNQSVSILYIIFKRSIRHSIHYINEFLFYDFYSRVFNYLSNRIEYTIHSYTGIQCFFYPTVYLTFKPFIQNSKLICEYTTMSLENGSSINNVWKNIKWWIVNQQSFSDSVAGGTLKSRILWLSRNPLKGIRIICKGPNYKARRKRKFVFHSWISDDSVTGKMPTQSFSSQIDFYQSFAIMKQATIGVRVWTLFEFIRK